MKQNGFITSTGKYHYILLTDRKNVTIYMIAAFVRKIAETQGLPPEKAEAILQDREARAEVRKRIERCTYEVTDGKHSHVHIEVGSHSILNYPINDKRIVIFGVEKIKPIISEIYKEA